MSPNPFAVLGLPERPDLDDETVRAAWRQIAAATHPDRADGGDLARYTQATAAYAELRTPWSRSEAYADLAEQARREGRYDAYPDRDLGAGGPAVTPWPDGPAAEPWPTGPVTAPLPAVPAAAPLGCGRPGPGGCCLPWPGSPRGSAAGARCACSSAPPWPPACPWPCWP